MRKLFALSALSLLCATSTAHATTKLEKFQKKTDSLIASTWHRQIVMGEPLTPTTRSYRRTRSTKYAAWVYHHWKRVNWKVIQQFRAVPLRGSWRCIHQYEGSWNDRGAPYYGGLQMNITFQNHYGHYLLRTKGTADRWTPLEQMWVATKAYMSGRGFYPWPNTARACGLI